MVNTSTLLLGGGLAVGAVFFAKWLRDNASMGQPSIDENLPEGIKRAAQQALEIPRSQSSQYLITGKPVEQATVSELLRLPSVQGIRSFGSGNGVDVEVTQSVLPGDFEFVNRELFSPQITHYLPEKVQTGVGMVETEKLTTGPIQERILKKASTFMASKYVIQTEPLWNPVGALLNKFAGVEE